MHEFLLPSDDGDDTPQSIDPNVDTNANGGASSKIGGNWSFVAAIHHMMSPTARSSLQNSKSDSNSDSASNKPEDNQLSKRITSQNPKFSNDYLKQIDTGLVLDVGSKTDSSLSESWWGVWARYFGGMIGLVDREVRFISEY
jgi:hypothetical protein